MQVSPNFNTSDQASWVSTAPRQTPSQSRWILASRCHHGLTLKAWKSAVAKMRLESKRQRHKSTEWLTTRSELAFQQIESSLEAFRKVAHWRFTLRWLILRNSLVSSAWAVGCHCIQLSQLQKWVLFRNFQCFIKCWLFPDLSRHYPGVTLPWR